MIPKFCVSCGGKMIPNGWTILVGKTLWDPNTGLPQSNKLKYDLICENINEKYERDISSELHMRYNYSGFERDRLRLQTFLTKIFR